MRKRNHKSPLIHKVEPRLESNVHGSDQTERGTAWNAGNDAASRRGRPHRRNPIPISSNTSTHLHAGHS